MCTKILNKKSLPSNIVDMIVEQYDARYICDTDIFLEGEWIPNLVALFYAESPPEDTNWIGFTYLHDEPIVIRGNGALEETPYIRAVYTPDGYMYSTHMSDKRSYTENGYDITISGGRSEPLIKGDAKVVDLIITPNGLEIVH
jgi:hypothetical protein